ncbi:MAG: nucleoside recognition domain-containing protein [Clostridia bacterium]
MMNGIWAVMGVVGLIWGLCSGRGATLTAGILQTAMEAVQLSLRLAGGFALWSGMLAILEQTGAIRYATRMLQPILSWLFPHVVTGGPAQQAIAMNLAANMLGLGNAATPMGLEAMRLMADDAKEQTATDAMCMFLVLNASSVQLFPSTVIALRAAAGSMSPASIVMTTLLATMASTLVGVCACKGFAHARKGCA